MSLESFIANTLSIGAACSRLSTKVPGRSRIRTCGVNFREGRRIHRQDRNRKLYIPERIRELTQQSYTE